jgi:hypothetical protein
MTTYTDKATCPEGHHFNIRRRIESAGFMTATDCRKCGKQYELMAGPLPLRAVKPPQAPTHERQIEARLAKRVGELGGEVRKVAWIGRKGAPDRLVMLPYDAFNMRFRQTIWVELKAPGKARTFPANPHERAQHREHERMRKMGQRVEVVDSYEQIEELLK